MKISFFAPWQIPDGIYTYTRFLTESLKKIGVNNIIIPQQAYKVKFSFWSNSENLKKIQEAGEKLSQADVAHIQHEFGLIGNWKNPFDQTLKTLIRSITVPKVITLHGFHPWMLEMDPTRPHPPFRTFKKMVRFAISKSHLARYTFGKVFDEADAVIVHNQFAKDHLVSLGVTQSKIIVIPHGVVTVNLNLRDLEIGQFRKRYGIERDRKLLTIFGFIDYSKGYELVLEILPEISQEYVLVIAGGTRLPEQEMYLDSLKSLISQKGLADRVVITGFLEENEIPTLMQETEVLLAPQRYANTSGSLHLGLGAGKAILASDLEFAKEINERVECLSLFRRGNSQELKERLLSLLSDPKFCDQLEQKALEYAQKFSWDEVAKLHLKIYQEDLMRLPVKSSREG